MVQSCRNVVIDLSSYTGDVRTLAAVLLLLAVFGASTQCVADCLPQQNTPPCHQHSQKAPQNDPCKHGQFVAGTHAGSDEPLAQAIQVTPAADPAETSVN